MIYLIQDCYKDDNGNFVDILKIGYSSKPFKESRENQYKTHNYGFKLLQEREGDTELENYLHKRFSKYLLPDSYEWFYYNEEIINGFNVIQNIIATTKEKYIENIKCYLLNTLERPEELYKIHKTSIIEELQKYPEYNKEEENIYNLRIRESFKLWYTLIKSNIENNCILSNPYFNDIPEEIEKEWLEKNPWKTRAILYFNETLINFTEEQSRANIDAKIKATEEALENYEKMDDIGKEIWGEIAADVKNLYQKNYIGVSSRTGKAIFNYLVKIAEERVFDISRKENIKNE